jgi:hypothetical protein
MRVRYHPPLHADAALAQRIERAEIDFCALGATHAGERPAALEVAGGRALFSARGSFLNKVLGLGVGAPVRDEDLDAVQAFYARHGEAARIELCPVAPADVGARLTARGFRLEEFENELARRLPLSREERAEMAASIPATVVVERTAAAEDERWVTAVGEGFGTQPETMRPFVHPSIVRYLVRVEGEIAGGGAAYQHDGVLGIFGTATIDRFRRRGVQTALVVQALLDAGGDADLAIATTAPGSTSQRTFERLGFQVMYTRAILVLPLQRPGHGPLRSA